MNYEVGFIEALTDGLVLLRWDSYTSSDRRCLWTQVKVRKPHKCAVTGSPIAVGDMAFMPIGNVDYRMRRISVPVISAVITDTIEKVDE